jgi:hypothetical protein
MTDSKSLSAGPHLYGLQAIARHLGISRGTALAWLQNRALLAYRRQSPKSRRMVWYSNVGLLHRWEIVQCAQDIKAARAKRKGSSDAPTP